MTTTNSREKEVRCPACRQWLWVCTQDYQCPYCGFYHTHVECRGDPMGPIKVIIDDCCDTVEKKEVKPKKKNWKKDRFWG